MVKQNKIYYLINLTILKENKSNNNLTMDLKDILIKK